MRSRRVESTGEYVCRLTHDADGLEDIKTFAAENNITSGVFTLIGAVQSASIGYYDQNEHVYRKRQINEALEIVSCTGNICLKDGEAFVHAHAVLAYEDGSTVGGHLTAMKVFAGEMHLKAFEKPVERVPDDETSLSLMNL